MASAVCAAVSLALLTGCAPRGPRLLPKGQAPLELALPRLGGGSLELASLRGKVVLLDFWATWCEPCKEGLSHTQALVAAHASRGLAGVTISIDEDEREVPAFVAALHLELPVLLDPGGVVVQELGGEQLPYQVLLDRSGARRASFVGLTPLVEREVAETIERLLAE